jgi:hypothetical protein
VEGEVIERLRALEAQMREVREALSLDDPGLARDWVGAGVDRDTQQKGSPR